MIGLTVLVLSWTLPPTPINVYFDPGYEGVAYASGNQIVGSVDYYRTHTSDVGSMIHEMAHVIQSYPSCYSSGGDYFKIFNLF